MVIKTQASTLEKLQILSDAAKYDVACTSSGVDRKGVKGEVGNSCAAGICHSFAADGRCISLLKVLYSNECIYDCKYCVNRASNDTVRVSFDPDELASLTIDFYHRNYIEGLFLSSGVKGSPDYTMEQMNRCLRLLREKYKFNGYIHCKAIPGADPYLVEEAGWLADRMSVNMELPTEESLRSLAPNKTKKSILRPLNQIHLGIDESRETFGLMGGNRSAYYFTTQKVEDKKRREANILEMSNALDGDSSYGPAEAPLRPGSLSAYSSSPAVAAGKAHGSISSESGVPRHLSLKDYAAGKTFPSVADVPGRSFADNLPVRSSMQNVSGSGSVQALQSDHPDTFNESGASDHGIIIPQTGKSVLTMKDQFNGRRGFVAAGQSTQMIIGATPETDYSIINVTQDLYRTFDLKRVFFSAFINLGTDPSLPDTSDGPQLKREHRLYQADFLMRFYGFDAGELLSRERPNFNVFLDPKGDWAVRNIGQFPVEIEKADYLTLLRVPGIGPKSARRIVAARRTNHLDFNSLKKMGVVLKRALYFITCNGKMMYPITMDSDWISRQLAGVENSDLPLIDDGLTYKQMSLFDQASFNSYRKEISGKYV